MGSFRFHQAFGSFEELLKQASVLGEIEDADQEFDRISSRVFYVKSAHSPQKPLSWGPQAVLFFFTTGLPEVPENDGLLNIRDQMLNLDLVTLGNSKSYPAFGIDLGILEDDHIELVGAGVVSGSNQGRRKAFTRALLTRMFINLNK